MSRRRARVVRELVLPRARARAGATARTPRSRCQFTRCSIQYWCHSSASAGGTKNSISICSNSRTRKRKFPGVISLRKLLPICAMPNGGLTRSDDVTFLKLTKMPCAVSGPEIGDARVVAHGADVRLEHQVEVARLRQVAVGRLARMLRRPACRSCARLEVVGAEAQLAGAAVDHRVGERLRRGRRRPRPAGSGSPPSRARPCRRAPGSSSAATRP